MASTSASTSAAFGDTHVVFPTASHVATIVWLHELGGDGFNEAKKIRNNLRLPNIKFICPTAPTREVDGSSCIEWCNKGDMEAAAAYTVYLLSCEPADVKLCIAGKGMGASVALYSATSYVLGKYASGRVFPSINLTAICSIDGYILDPRVIQTEIRRSISAIARAGSFDLLLCHVMAYYDDETLLDRTREYTPYSTDLISAGFSKLDTRLIIPKIVNYPTEGEFDKLRIFLNRVLELPNV